MSWRVIVISKQSKLDLKMGNLVVRGDTKIHLSEMSMLIVESTAVSLTAALLCEMVKKKIKVIFCDEQRNPLSEIVPYYGSYDTSAKIRAQIGWSEVLKGTVWTEIVRNKLKQQEKLLFRLGKKQHELLAQYISELEFEDETNREGHGAKVYFNALFGTTFTRNEASITNGALNYGYSIFLSAVNREIVSNGYITQLGLHHDNIFNKFNLGSDLMEPFRPLVDRAVFEMNPEKFEKEEKYQLVNLLNKLVIMDGEKHFVNNAVKIYCKSVFDALNDKDVECIKFYRDEL